MNAINEETNELGSLLPIVLRKQTKEKIKKIRKCYYYKRFPILLARFPA